jgi:hypothetical protein
MLLSAASPHSEHENRQTKYNRRRMKTLLTFAAIAEAVAGLAMLLVPSTLGRLILGPELA